jgi:hypothetical protein
MTVTLTWVCLPPDCARVAVETGAATRRPRYYRHGFDIDTLFWGALIFLALFVFCLLAWKAIERLRNRRKFDDVAVGGGHMKGPKAPGTPRIPGTPNRGGRKAGGQPDRAFEDRAFRRIFEEQWRGQEHTDMAGMNQREQEEFLLAYGPRKERKAIRERRKAREQAQKKRATHRL